MAQVADAVQVRSLAQKLPPATAKAKEKKKKRHYFMELLFAMHLYIYSRGV